MNDSAADADELPILYNDEWLVAVAKPSGLFVHRSNEDRSATSFVLQQIRDQLGHFVYPVHRLDRATSGIVVLAKMPEAASGMGLLFTERRVSKTYQALVRGFCDDHGSIRIPLVSSLGRGSPAGHPQAAPQDAETHYETRQRFELPLPSGRYPTTRCSLVEVRPVTGRYHQIRRHFNQISHPVLGDTSHGDSHQNRFYRNHLNLTRLMLAAVRLQFPHPVTGQTVLITCPPEVSFQAVIDRLQQFQPRA
ncbi:MAG: pseudouridine synthase [Fuerstiella sp.]